MTYRRARFVTLVTLVVRQRRRQWCSLPDDDDGVLKDDVVRSRWLDSLVGKGPALSR
ncbi:unnamed protein product, partial [Nesidiocoris tenuis]